MGKFVHLMSGGLDSTVLLYDILDQGHKAHCILFDYGQRHIKELGFAEATCAKLGVSYDKIALPPQLFERSALTTGGDSLVGTPTVVPNRNMVLISMAASYALSHGCMAVSCAINGDDSEVYPDCRSEFIKHLNSALRCCHTRRRMEVHVPYIVRTKAAVVAIGMRLNVPLNETWSCYAGGDEPCGQCGACQVRLKAIDDACHALQ